MNLNDFADKKIAIGFDLKGQSYKYDSNMTGGPVTKDYYTDDEFNKIDETLTEKYNSLLDEISKYSMLTENIHDLHDESNRMNLFAKLSYGLRKSGEAKAWVIYHLNVAESETKASLGVASLDDFPEYVLQNEANGKTIKTTDSVREAFVVQCERVKTAKKKLAMLKAMDEVISIYKSQFVNGISTIKAMVYGNKDSNIMSSLDNTSRL